MITRIAFVSMFVLSLVAFGCGSDDKPVDTPDAEPQPVEPSCQEYCATITANCVDANAQFANAEECETFCADKAGWELGTAADTGGNTVGCRAYHAGAAAGDPATHCVHAGPSGANTCGSWCENYCQMALKNCVDGNALYADQAACETACAAFPADGVAGATGGDTVQCRLYHAGAAYDDPGTHCPHVAEDGGGVCADL